MRSYLQIRWGRMNQTSCRTKNSTHILRKKKKWLTCGPGVPVVYEHRQAGSRGAGFQFALVMCAPFWPVQLHWQFFGLVFRSLDTELRSHPRQNFNSPFTKQAEKYMADFYSRCKTGVLCVTSHSARASRWTMNTPALKIHILPFVRAR